MAAAWLLYVLTDSPVLLGLIGLFLAVPIFIAVPYAGAVADRLPPRKVLVATQAFGLVNSLVLGVLVLAGLVQPWHVYLQAFLQATVSAFDVTARQTLFPRLVANAQLEQAVTLNFSVARIGMLVGPPIGGILIAQTGNAVPFFFNAATYVIMLAAMLVVRPREQSTARKKASIAQDVFAGIVFVSRSPLLSSMLLFAALWAILSHNPALLTIFARDVLQVGPEGLGALSGASAIGQLAGGLVLVGMGEVRDKGRMLMSVGAVYTGTMLVFAFSNLFALSLLLLVLSGIASAMFSATRHTILMRVAPEDMRGRVSGTHLLVTRGATPLSQTVSGAFVSLLGPTFAVTGATLLLGAACVYLAVGTPVLRALSELNGSAQPSSGKPQEAASGTG